MADNTVPLHDSLYAYTQAAREIAKAQGMSERVRDEFTMQMLGDINRDELKTRDKDTGFRLRKNNTNTLWHFLAEGDVNAWLEKQGVPYRWHPQRSVMDDAGSATSGSASVQTVLPVTVDGTGTHNFVHSTKTRRNDLTPAIELAQGRCRNPKDTAEVWAELEVLAKEKKAPFIGSTEEGLQYTKGGDVKFFTRKSLRKRLNR